MILRRHPFCNTNIFSPVIAAELEFGININITGDINHIYLAKCLSFFILKKVNFTISLETIHRL